MLAEQHGVSAAEKAEHPPAASQAMAGSARPASPEQQSQPAEKLLPTEKGHQFSQLVFYFGEGLAPNLIAEVG